MNPQYECALVTGASSGLGAEFVLQLAPRVRQLVLVARREAMLLELAAKLRGAFPGLAVTVLAADLANADDRGRLLARLTAQGLAPDLLVNNAGLGDYGDFVTAEWPKLEAMLRVNVEALTHLTHELLPGMVQRGRGAVVNVSSLASVLPIPDFAVYAATKAYVTSFSEALRLELRDHGIAVLALCPGPVHTEFGAVARREERIPGIPGREGFYVPKEEVVAEALAALARDRARIYPGFRTAIAAAVLSALPISLVRLIMGTRPRMM